MCFNALCVYLYVGRSCDPNFLLQLFETNDLRQIDFNKGEDWIFREERTSASGYLANLYGLINQVRYQRQPFCQLKVLVEGDPASEKIMAQLLVLDQRGFTYAKDFGKL